MNYFEIGQRIRKFRKASLFSQEQLAEKVGISVTHMSHIETGNTKLSLPVFVEIANALNVQTDELLYDTPEFNKTLLKQSVSDILDSCTVNQSYILMDVIKALNISLNKYM